jgi:septum site-determining protein MinD
VTAGGKTIVVCGGSGGVGTTLVSANLAAALTGLVGGRVLLIDGHHPIPGEASAIVGVERARAAGEMIPLLPKLTPDMFSSYLTSSAAGISVLPLIGDVQQARHVTADVVRRVFELARRVFAAIVVDEGWASGALTAAIVEHADVACLVTEPTTYGLQRARGTLDYFRTLQLGRDAVVVCLNRCLPRGVITPDIAQATLQTKVSAAIPEDPQAIQEASARKQLIVVSNPRHAVAREIDRLARELSSRNLRVAQVVSRSTADAQAAAADQVRDAKLRVHRRLVSEIDLRKGEADYMRDPVKLAELRRRAEAKVTTLVDEEAPGTVSREARARIIKEVLDEALGLGPLEDLLADPTVSEIMVNGPSRIYVERKGRLELTDARFLANEQLRGTIERIVAPLGRRIDEKVPMVDARLPDGSRVNAIIPPLALDGAALTIRKFSKSFLGIDDLVRFGSFTQQMAALFGAAVRVRQNIVVSGGTGSGKTTLLNLLASFIPADERIVTVEDSAELRLAQDHIVRLESRPANIEGEGAITIRDLVRNALRMRPDRIVVGECRGGETLDMLQAMNTGHDGSLTTVHANTPADALARIETMSLMAGLDLPSRAIRDQIASAVHLIIQQARLPDGSRRVTHVSEVRGLVDGAFSVADIFVFKQTGLAPDGKVLGQFLPTGHVPAFVDLLSRRGIALPREIFLHQTA